jgi:hypothetical protein
MTIKSRARLAVIFSLVGVYSISSLLAFIHIQVDLLHEKGGQQEPRSPTGHQPSRRRATKAVLSNAPLFSPTPLPSITTNTTLTLQNSSSSIIQDEPSIDIIPPLASLVNFSTNEIQGDVQFLLDYAVVGFAKCGSTTLSMWLDKHPEISDFPREVWDVYHGRNVDFIQRMHDKRAKEIIKSMSKQSNHSQHHGDRKLHGYKCPGDITRQQPLNTLTKHFPKTKLIITMRHPVLFFQSFYNYRASLKQFRRIPGKPKDLIGPEKEHDVLATAQSAFHVFLASLGKTDMTTDDERNLLQGFYKDEILEATPVTMPHKVFLMEMTQLADRNETRSKIFRQDLQNFLGLKQPLASIPHHRPNAKHEDRLEEQVEKAGRTKIDICDPEHLEVREELLRISRAASQWIRRYFVSSPDVIVSSPRFFDEVLESWMANPCDVQQNVSEATM